MVNAALSLPQRSKGQIACHAISMGRSCSPTGNHIFIAGCPKQCNNMQLTHLDGVQQHFGRIKRTNEPILILRATISDPLGQ